MNIVHLILYLFIIMPIILIQLNIDRNIILFIIVIIFVLNLIRLRNPQYRKEVKDSLPNGINRFHITGFILIGLPLILFLIIILFSAISN